MSRVVNSPVAYFPGSVTIPTSFGYPVYARWLQAFREPSELLSIEDGKAALKPGKTVAELNYSQVPEILAVVERFDLKNFPENVTQDTFPIAPREQASALITWLLGEVRKAINGEIEIPNG